MTSHSYREIADLSQLPGPDESGVIAHYVFQYIDFGEVPQYVAAGHRFSDCFFFGCEIPTDMEGQIGCTCLVFPRLGLAYSTFRGRLYTAEELYEGFDPDRPDSFATCFDTRVYNDYVAKGKECNDIRETLGRNLHDRAIQDAMSDFLSHYGICQVVAIMGGHALRRTDPEYRCIARISKALTEKGKLMVSGGGPGAMEATHLGAWLAGRTDEEVEDAVDILASAGEKDPARWLKSALEVKKKYPQDRFLSLSIPTWLYGHEPSTPFATHIAKFFTNSVREDMILSVTLGGILFTPGSAGTMQEIFQSAAKIHYDSDGIVGPMVFLGRDFFERIVPVYPFLEDLSERGKYKNFRLFITDNPADAIAFLGAGVKA